MYEINVSRRYGGLFKLSVSYRDKFGSSLVFPQGDVPLVTRTDSSARKIGRDVVEHLESRGELDCFLSVGGYALCEASVHICKQIAECWKVQHLNLGEVKILPISEGIPRPNVAKDDVLKSIYMQCLPASVVVIK